MNEIKIWAQMFFDDGSISEGKRIPAETLDDDTAIYEVGYAFLKSLGRTEGFLVLWGAGNIVHMQVNIPTCCQSSGLDSSVSLPDSV